MSVDPYPERIGSGLNRLLGSDPGPFALLHRPASGDPDHLDLLLGCVTSAHELARLPVPRRCGTGRTDSHRCSHRRDEAVHGTGREVFDLLALVPYRQVVERGFACSDDQTPVLALTVHTQDRVPVWEALQRIPDMPVTIRNSGFDLDDGHYAALVRDVIKNEIDTGEGSNFVIKRSFVAELTNFSPAVALAIFRRLLADERGAYCTFIVHTGSRTFVGASPEQHARLHGGTLSMNPISGTYRYPSSGPTLAGVLRFLGDRKEADELYMVLDEELKTMARVCLRGGRVSGPFLKEMARLAHTEYVLRGDSSLNVLDTIRETMFAPTVTGSPLENACRVIARYEPRGRGYYGGILALIGCDSQGEQLLDSAILIRTADIDCHGRLSLGVGATLVRDSQPEAEAAETRAKAAGMLASLGVEIQQSAGPRPSPASIAPVGRLGDHPGVREGLHLRNTALAQFWLDPPRAAEPPRLLAGRSVLVLDAEDTFTAMLGHQLRALGLAVTVAAFDRAAVPGGHDLVILGPGPGDPRQRRDPRIAALRRITARLLQGGTPFLAVCLSHQVLSSVLGLDLVRRPRSAQGTQLEIDLFGSTERVGFYNSYVATSEADRVECGLRAPVEVSRDPDTGEVHALRGPGFASVQFHPESVLTQNGIDILATLLSALVAAPAPTG